MASFCRWLFLFRSFQSRWGTGPRWFGWSSGWQAALLAALVSLPPAGAAAAEAGAVRLLVPITRGDEWGRLVSVVPGAQLVDWRGRMVVLVGHFRNAESARSAGVRLQRRTRLVFLIDVPAVVAPPAEGAEALGGPLRLEDLRPSPVGLGEPMGR